MKKLNLWCKIFGHTYHYSAPEGCINHHRGYDDCFVCEVCGKVKKHE